eukprot:gene5469-3862_t
MRVASRAALLALAQQCRGHAYMTQPRSRMAEAARPQSQSGLSWREWEPQSSGGGGGYAPCGTHAPHCVMVWCGNIGGRPYSPPDLRWNAAHAHAHQRIVKGGVLQLQAAFSAHHYGHVEFSLCDTDTLDMTGTADVVHARLWACFNKESNLLVRHPDYEAYDPAPIDPNFPYRYYIPPKKTLQSWPMPMWFKVPQTANCDGDNCLLFFFYYSANSCEAAGYRSYFTGTKPNRYKSAIPADWSWTCN